MRTDTFDFDLPDDLVALRPAEPRESARMLVVQPNGTWAHHHVGDLPLFLKRGDVAVLNDSRVINARLSGTREPRADGHPVAVEVTLHRRVAPDQFWAFAQPARRIRAGDRLDFGGLSAQAVQRDGGNVLLSFPLASQALDAAIAATGQTPLPPYIAKRRAPDERDRTDYQTVYARRDGSVAAPTAGLHFTPALFQALSDCGVELAPVTLHVGAGTFLPVSAEDTAQHHMHAETAHLDGATAARLNAVHARGGRILAVGTTSLRTLESAAAPDGTIQPFAADTDIFITPGYRFRAVDMLLTNFHLPRSTLFMLVSAFMGLEVMRAAYADAIARGYRFYSYGDACLLMGTPSLGLSRT